MYIKFTCPLCNTKNFLSSKLGERQSYSQECRGCQQSVTWVGSEGLAKEKRKGANDYSVKVEPGVLATIEDAEAGISIGSKDDVADLMKTGTAGAAVVDIYSQGERIKEFSPTDKSVQEGVCNGQSLHWIRRVLQGGRAEYKVLEKKVISTQSGPQEVTRNAQVIDTHRKAQHMGGVVAQKATSPAELKKYSDAAHAEYDKAWDVLDKKRNAAKLVYDKKMGELGGTKNPDGGWSYFVNEKTSAVVQEWNDVCAFVKAEKDKLTLAKESREKAGTYKYHWEQIAQNLDARLLQAAIARKKRTFSGIVALKNLNRETCAGGTSAFADRLLADTDFKVGTCALVSAGLKIGIGEGGGKISGHAVAVHFAKNNVLRIFDPNIGVFTCTSKGGLKSALVAMIDVGWVKVFGWQLDEQFGYSLFEARPSAVDLTPKQTPVDYAVSAETTAIQNKTIIPSSTEAPKVAPTKPPVVIKPVAPSTGTGGAKGGASSQPSSASAGGSPLKQLLVEYRDNPQRQISGAFGSHGTRNGGWVSVPHTLIQKIKAANLTDSEFVKVGPAGKFAVAREHIDWLIARA